MSDQKKGRSVTGNGRCKVKEEELGKPGKLGLKGSWESDREDDWLESDG